MAPVGASQYLLCGALQFLSAFGYSYLLALVSIQGYKWISAGSGFVDIYCRAILASGAGFLGMCILPILAKWTLIGRWKPQQIRVWSLAVLPFLARQNAGAIEPAGSVRRFADITFSTCGRWARRLAETC